MNQRTIKFRAWDAERKIMTYPTNAFFHEIGPSTPMLTICPDIDDPESAWFITWDGDSDNKQAELVWGVVCMQYLGFENKFNEELWESDIVEHPTTKLRGEIFYGADAYYVKWFSANIPYTEVGISGLSVEMKKFGNIYETPELIWPKISV